MEADPNDVADRLFLLVVFYLHPSRTAVLFHVLGFLDINVGTAFRYLPHVLYNQRNPYHRSDNFGLRLRLGQFDPARYTMCVRGHVAGMSVCVAGIRDAGSPSVIMVQKQGQGCPFVS